jgi:hypothetical protein
MEAVVRNYNTEIYETVISYFMSVRFGPSRRWELLAKIVLRRMYGPKKAKITGGTEKITNKELHNLYSSQNIISVMKSRTMRWPVHVV